jgi:hypothetical protein
MDDSTEARAGVGVLQWEKQIFPLSAAPGKLRRGGPLENHYIKLLQ